MHTLLIVIFDIFYMKLCLNTQATQRHPQNILSNMFIYGYDMSLSICKPSDSDLVRLVLCCSLIQHLLNTVSAHKSGKPYRIVNWCESESASRCPCSPHPFSYFQRRNTKAPRHANFRYASNPSIFSKRATHSPSFAPYVWGHSPDGDTAQEGESQVCHYLEVSDQSGKSGVRGLHCNRVMEEELAAEV